MRSTAALAMVRLREVDEFEVEAEGAGQVFREVGVACSDAGDGLIEKRLGAFDFTL